MLYVDNWYTNEALFQYLYENKTCAAGTARKNRCKLPTSFKQEKLQRGQFAFRRNENMLAVRYQDKKEIYMLSTMHKADSVNVNRRNRRNDQIQKPTVIHDYNQKMGGIDKNGAMIGNYSCICKSYKWYTKIFSTSWKRQYTMHLLYTTKLKKGRNISSCNSSWKLFVRSSKMYVYLLTLVHSLIA